MSLPFGLDLWSIVVGIVLAMFVWPWIQGMFFRPRGVDKSAG